MLKSSLSVFVLCLAALSQCLAAAPAKPWPHQGSDLQPDAAVTWGTLSNGLRYAVMPHKEPPERVSLRMLVESGSLNETDAQQGLAHFLEHMAFNGTRRFPGNEMVEYYQRLGMGFGADTNAHTSFAETVYKLELPNDSADLLDDGISLLRDYADGMLLEVEEIEAERGVILSEKRARDSAGYRTIVAEYGFVFEGLQIPERLPIGKEEIIKNVPKEEFVDYYEKYYALDRLVIVAVGAIDEEQLVPVLEKHFGSMKMPEPGTPDREMGTLDHEPLKAMVHIEPETPEATVSIQTVTAFDEGVDRKERRARKIRVQLAQAMIDRRLEKLAKEADAVFTSGSAYSWDYLNAVEISGIELKAKQENYLEAFKIAEQELRRALEHGFTKTELGEATANFRNDLLVAAKSAPSRKSRELSGAIVSAISRDVVFTSPEQDLALFDDVVATINPKVIHEALKDAWSTDNTLLFAAGNLAEDATEAKLLAAYEASRAIAVEAPEDRGEITFAYDEPGERGRIMEEHFHKDLEILQCTLQNHVHLNLKQTDFEENIIRITLRVGGGLLEAVDAPEGITVLADAAFTAGGLEAHSQDELQSIFAGKTVGVNFSVGESAFELNATTTPRDLWLQLKLLTAYLKAPGYRPESLAQAHKQFDALYVQLKQTAEGVIGNEVARKLASGDKRLGYPPLADLKALTLEQLANWLSEPLANGYLEVSIVGDIDFERTRALVEKTLGTLPDRAASKPAYNEARQLKLPEAGVYRFPVDTEIQRAFVVSHLPTVSLHDIQKARRMGMLANILDDRLRVKIREEIGESYSPYSYNDASDTFKGYGYTRAVVNVQPGQGDAIAEVLKELVANMVNVPVDEDELERARAPLLNQLKEYVRNNGYWLNRVLAQSQAEPERLDWARTFVQDYEAITLEELQALAEEYYKPENLITVLVRPAE